MPAASRGAKDALAMGAGYGGWEEWCEAVARAKGRPVCGGKCRDGTPCEQAPMTDRKRCRMHGGGSPRGPASPQWRTGEWSKYGPLVTGRLAEQYARLEEAVRDAFDLSAEARLLDARMADVIEGLREGGQVRSEELFGIHRSLTLVVEEVGEEDPAALVEAVHHVLARVGEFAERAQRDETTWREWGRLVSLKRNLVDTRVRQKAQEHGPVHWEDLAFIVERLRAIVAQFVPPARLPELSDELRRLGGVLPGFDATGGTPLN